MGSEWPVASFHSAPLEIIDGDRGKNYPKQEEFSVSGHCLFLNAGNVTVNGFNFSDCAFITEQKDSLLRKGKMIRQDVILTTRGTVGNVAFFDDTVPFEHIRINSGMVILRPRPSVLHPRYLYLFVRSPDFHSQALSLRTGSAQPQLPIRDIKKIEIPIPPLPEQRAIAHILGSLDDKIELNRRMNRTLEAIAQAIFKSWFVDFDPVRAKAEGRPTGLPDDIAALFPDNFEDSELGEIPKGWRVMPLSEVVNIIGGGTPKTKVKEYWGGNIPWFSVVDAPTETDVFVIDTEKHITKLGVDKSSTKVLRKGTTIISARGTVGKCALVGRPMAMNQSCYGIQGKNGESDYFVYFNIRRQVSDLQRSGHGSVFNTITRDTFKTIRIACPTTNITTSYEEIVHPVMELVLAILHDNATLTSLRETLLPKLISGELRISDAEKFVEEAGV